MKHLILNCLVAATMVVFCNSGQAAELSEGSGLSPASAVKVLSAESEEDLSRSVTAWVEQRYPQDTITVRGFQYLADDRALHVIKTLTMEGTHRTIFFETPGLPFQFVRKKP